MLKPYLKDAAERIHAARSSATAMADLCALYVELIGYDPHEDDPNIYPGEVFDVLRDWCYASAADDDSLSVEECAAAIDALDLIFGDA